MSIERKVEALEGLMSALIDIIGPLQPPSVQKQILDLWNEYVDFTAVEDSDE